MPKPTVFIGSSTEQLATAHALAERLRAFANPTVWDNAEFELNESIFDGLLKAAQVTDYAVFVFDPDDVTRIRNVDSRTVRDNVLFEFGLFIGRMGKGRTFWISARAGEGHHIPTDLIGITHLSFTRPKVHQHESLVSALGEASERLRGVIERQGRRDDRAVEELNTVKILCLASAEYDEPKFAHDIEQIRQNFPADSITSAHGVNGTQLYSFFLRGTWDIVHLAMYVDPKSGDLIVPDPHDHEATMRKVIPVDGVDKLITMATPRLVVVVTCDSLVLAARLARHTNTIAGHQPIDVGSALRWSSVFYPALAQGCPLSEAFNRAQTLTDPGLVLISKRDFRLTLPSVDSVIPLVNG
jgi:hypothetical protein